MKALGLGLFVLGVVGCTKPNPASCGDGTCTDPSLPFCDVDGSLGGQAGACIAVACTANEFAECRADKAVTCNAQGTDYDITQCPLGCDAAVGGCRLCQPSQTVCQNGAVATCDANGAVVSTQTCPLGCFEDQPRCRDIDPSNNLAMYLDMVTDPQDLDLSNAAFDTGTGAVTVGAQTIDVPNFLVPASGNGVPMRVFVVNSARLTSATIGHLINSAEHAGPGFALVAHGDISLSGEFLVWPSAGAALLGCRPAGPGIWNGDISSGGGGGANGGDGADGGSVSASFPGGVKDLASGTAVLVPLRGGCGGGVPGGTVFPDGGGAIQLTSGTRIDVDATVDVRGQAGSYEESQDQSAYAAGGGGGGGSILFEAPEVTLSPIAKLLTAGGDGYSTCPFPNCGAAGVGGTATVSSTKGMDVAYVVGATAGGGGGGVGRVRINTGTGTYTKSSSTVEDAVLTTGSVSTR